MKYRNKIEKYHEKLEKSIQAKDVFQIERILTEIAASDPDLELDHHLRMIIIKG